MSTTMMLYQINRWKNYFRKVERKRERESIECQLATKFHRSSLKRIKSQSCYNTLATSQGTLFSSMYYKALYLVIVICVTVSPLLFVLILTSVEHLQTTRAKLWRSFMKNSPPLSFSSCFSLTELWGKSSHDIYTQRLKKRSW